MGMVQCLPSMPPWCAACSLDGTEVAVKCTGAGSAIAESLEHEAAIYGKLQHAQVGAHPGHAVPCCGTASRPDYCHIVYHRSHHVSTRVQLSASACIGGKLLHFCSIMGGMMHRRALHASASSRDSTLHLSHCTHAHMHARAHQYSNVRLWHVGPVHATARVRWAQRGRAALPAAHLASDRPASRGGGRPPASRRAGRSARRARSRAVPRGRAASQLRGDLRWRWLCRRAGAAAFLCRILAHGTVGRAPRHSHHARSAHIVAARACVVHTQAAGSAGGLQGQEEEERVVILDFGRARLCGPDERWQQEEEEEEELCALLEW